MLYKGSCHCGNVSFDVEGELSQVVACNCSICVRRGALLWAVPRGQLRLLRPDEGIGTYTFNNHVIAHRFCRTCGIHPFSENTPGDEQAAYINVRCLEGIDPAAYPVIQFDGRSM